MSIDTKFLLRWFWEEPADNVRECFHNECVLSAYQEGLCGGLPALHLLRLGERAVLRLLRWLPEGVWGGDPVALPALWADGHGGGQQQLQLGGDGEGPYLG